MTKPSYAVVGRGRWAKVIHQALSAEGRRTCSVDEARRRVGESPHDYKARIAATLNDAGAQILWICVPPCPEVPLLIESAARSGLHVVVEKPWLLSPAETQPLSELARSQGVLAAIHFQYCFLNEVERLRARPQITEMLLFSGSFTLSRPDRLGIPALHNLGSHLFAIREYAVPRSQISVIRFGYDLTDERRVRVETENGVVDEIDLKTSEPLIPRFIQRFENAISTLDFPLDLAFAARAFSAAEAFSNPSPARYKS